jgi:Type II secretion system (T2SS), protein E, N-terminal domain
MSFCAKLRQEIDSRPRRTRLVRWGVEQEPERADLSGVAVNALDAVSPELVLVSPQLGRPEAAADGLADSILAGQALSERDLARLLAAQMGLPFVDLEHSTIDPGAARLLHEDDARMYSALPIALVDGRALLAVARPTNEPAIRRVAERLGREVDIAVAARGDLLRAIERAHGHAVQPLPAPLPPPVPVVEPAPEPVVEKAPARPRRSLRRRLLVAAVFVLAAPMTALAGNVTAQVLDGGQQPLVLRSTPTARALPGAEEWEWPAGEPGGELPLSPAFLDRVDTAARKARIDPHLLRAAIRARRGGGSPNLTRIARRLRGPDPWLALLAVEGRTGYADRALALARYYRAADRGLTARVELAPGARAQLESGLVDRRLIALAGYLAQALGGVRVTSVAEPRLDLAAPLATAHAQGRAIAIDVDGEGKQGTRLALAVRELLALPPELQPARLVSVLRLGRPAELHLAF